MYWFNTMTIDKGKEDNVKENDIVTICMPNTSVAVVTFYAINMIGATASMIHPLSSENEIEFYLNNSSYCCDNLIKLWNDTQ